MSKNGGHLTVQYNLRWSEELRNKITGAAKENTRSMNQEIIARLEDSFTLDKITQNKLSELTKDLNDLFDKNTQLRKENEMLKKDVKQIIKATVQETIESLKKQDSPLSND